MIPWWWAVVALSVGACFGVLAAGLLHAAGGDEERDRLLSRIGDLEREVDELGGER